MNQSDPGKVNNQEELSISDMVAKIRSAKRYIKSKWATILIAAILGALLGFSYSIYKKPTYIAVCNFVLEDSKGGAGLGQLASLASMAGISLGGGGGGNIFEGDNIMELYKSRDMIEKALLSEVTIKGKKQMLIDRYINFNKLRKKWKEDKDNPIDSIAFNGNSDQFSRQQDSIITDLAATFNAKILNVDKLDKKLSIISVTVTSRDETFSKMFADKLVETVNNFYVLTKTEKAYHSVTVLQKQADSLRVVLNSSISGVASAIDAAPNANPAMLTLRVPSQKKQIDVQSNGAMFAEIVKDLEIAKVTLREETPLIQVIDKPVYPLKVKGFSWLKGVLLGGIVFAFLTVLWLICKKLLQSVLS